jgi:hypothetical protein
LRTKWFFVSFLDRLNESADVNITINQYDIRKRFPTVYYNNNEMLPLTLGSLKIMTLITKGGGVTDNAKIVFTLQCTVYRMFMIQASWLAYQ